MIAAAVLNASDSVKKRSGGNFEPRDFFPDLPDSGGRKAQSVEDQLLIMQANVHLLSGNPL